MHWTAIRRQLLFVILLVAPPMAPAYADPYCYAELQSCRDELFLNDDVVAADNCFEANLTVSPPCDQVAAAFRAITRVLRFPEDPTDPVGFNNSWHEILDRYGFSSAGRSLYDLDPMLPLNLQGEIDLPANSPQGNEIQETIQNLAMVAAIDTSIAQLAAIASSELMYLVPTELAGIGIQRSSPLEIDHADRLAAMGTLRVLKANISMTLAYDLQFDLDSYTPYDEASSLQAHLIDAHPLLLGPTINACGVLTDARAAYQGAIDDFSAAIQSMLLEADAQNDDFITLDCVSMGGTLSCAEQSEYQAHAADLRDAMDGRIDVLDLETPHENVWVENFNRVVGTTIPMTGPDQGASVDLSLLFSCAPLFSWRSGGALPLIQFDLAESPTNFIDQSSFTDTTFGGILLPVPEPSGALAGFFGLIGLSRLARARTRRCASR